MQSSVRDERAPSRGVSVTRRGLFVLTGSAAVLLAASCGEDPDRTTWTRDADSLPDRQVWAHMVPQGLPLSEDPNTHYGSERPLSFAPAGTPYPQLVQSQLDQARAAGLTGMQILLLEGVNSGDDFVSDWMTAADPTWRDGARGFAVAACVQATTRSGADSLIREYAAAAEGRPSAARIDDALVVWVYDAPALSPDDWLACRRGLERDGIPVYIVAELRTAASQHDNTFDAAAVDPYAGLFEAVWLFDDHDFMILPDVARWAREHDTAFAGGILPGYNRETTNGGYVDARATELWRSQWQLQRDAGAGWATAVTWNDVVERTAVQPTTDWGTTRADLTAHYAAQFRGETPPTRDPVGYVTSPQFVLEGRNVLAEGLVINRGAEPVRVRVRVIARDERELASSDPVTVAAGEAGAAVLDRGIEADAGSWVYAVVDVTDGTGRRLSSTRGAPVVVYAPEDPAVPQPARRTYYSLASDRSAAFTDLMAPLPRDADARSLRLTAREPVRSLEVLHNTWPAGLAVGQQDVAYEDPPQSIVGGQDVTTPAHGFTVARVVAQDGTIAYSTPVYRRDDP